LCTRHKTWVNRRIGLVERLHPELLESMKLGMLHPGCERSRLMSVRCPRSVSATGRPASLMLEGPVPGGVAPRSGGARGGCGPDGARSAPGVCLCLSEPLAEVDPYLFVEAIVLIRPFGEGEGASVVGGGEGPVAARFVHHGGALEPVDDVGVLAL